MKKHKGEIIDSFANVYAEIKHKQLLIKDRELEMQQFLEILRPTDVQRLENGLKRIYAVCFLNKLDEIKQKLYPNIIVGYDSQIRKHKEGDAFEIRFSSGYNIDLTLSILANISIMKICFIFTPADFTNETNIKCNYEYSLNELSEHLLEDIITKALSSFYLSTGS